jgi:hypothetical protein
MKELYETSAKLGHDSGLKAIQDAAALFVSEKKWLQEEEPDWTHVLSIIHDH